MRAFYFSYIARRAILFILMKEIDRFCAIMELGLPGNASKKIILFCLSYKDVL